MSESPPAAAGSPGHPWSRILADISHDVRGAAGATDMWIELLGRARDDAERERALRELRQSLARAVRLAEDLTDAVALLEGEEEKTLLPFDLAAVVAGAERRVGPDARVRHIPLTIAVPDGLTHPRNGDEKAWERTVDRLVMAALKHAPGRKPFEVTVSAAPVAGGGIEIAMACGDLLLPGPLPLLDAWRAPRPPGGSFPLGLFLARARLERAGGRVEVREDAAGRRLVALMP
jgi:K+-sensing histidine kinase KdpD